jgi:hypothetical protein
VPVAHTDPTKFELASLARHVIATLVLFNATDTLGAGFGIGQDPIGSFGFVPAFFVPLGQIFAPGW